VGAVAECECELRMASAHHAAHGQTRLVLHTVPNHARVERPWSDRSWTCPSPCRRSANSPPPSPFWLPHSAKPWLTSYEPQDEGNRYRVV